MKEVEAVFLSHLHKNSSIAEVSSSLDSLLRHPIGNAPWPEFNYKPKVEFTIAHSNDCIFLNYYVTEAVVKAVYFKPNDPVYKDSCVEFFIAFDDEERYYNLEFNILGACKLNFGRGRFNRAVIAEELVRAIRYGATVQNNKEDHSVQWQLSLSIPVAVFSKHTIMSLSKKTGFANFYKCGDDLPLPHYLCWNNIESPEPDFHLRKYFGKISFL